MSDTSPNKDTGRKKKAYGQPNHDHKKPNQRPPKNPKQYRMWKLEKVANLKQKKEEKLLRQLAKQKKHNDSLLAAQKHLEEEQKKIEKIGRHYTVSIAVPGSIMDKAQSPELRTYLAGQIGRAAVVFNVDEIIVYNDGIGQDSSNTTEGEFSGVGKRGNGAVQLARILQYLECPQYLRKSFFPAHKDLQYAGLLNPLDSPHHMKIHDIVQYREGVVLDKRVSEKGGSYVNVGLYRPLQIDRQIKPGVRVTVKLDYTYKGKKKYKGKVVAPSEPRTHRGLYWGYSVRLANSFSAVFAESPFREPYDLRVGVSERGSSVDQFTPPTEYKHILLVFGGLKGLEASLEDDEQLDVDDPTLLFQHYLNTCPGSGSGTIRTEESLLISLSAIRFKLHKSDSEASSINVFTSSNDTKTIETTTSNSKNNKTDSKKNTKKVKEETTNNSEEVETVAMDSAIEESVAMETDEDSTDQSGDSSDFSSS